MRVKHHGNQLAKILSQVTSKYLHMPLLLSGGLDSTIICSLIEPGLTIVISFGELSQDLHHSRIVAQRYSRSHIEMIIDLHKYKTLVPHVIRILKTFDPIEVRNSCVLFVGIMELKNMGYSEVVTGDGADELFAGYNYLLRYYSEPSILERVLLDLWEYMHFASKDFGSAVGMKIYTPYLDEPFISFAKGLDVREKIGEKMGKKWGKYILRTAFENKLGTLVWREKMALEHGSKMDLVSRLIEEMVSKKEFELNKKRCLAEHVIIRTKEQMYYYEVYRSFFCPPYIDVCNSMRCPYCYAGITRSKRYCHTCGSFPLNDSKVPFTPR
jgi:asparagine synthase (glutamine-hydrolysing)